MRWRIERVTNNWLSILQTQLQDFGTEGPAVECAPPCRTSGSPGNQAVSPAPPSHVSLSVSTSPSPLLSSPLTGAQAGVATSTSPSTGPRPESERSEPSSTMASSQEPEDQGSRLSNSKVSAETQQEEIAIVGIGCQTPGADNIQDFWRVLVDGECHVTDVPEGRWNVSAFLDTEDRMAYGKAYVMKGGFLKDVEGFDNSLYGISDIEASKMDNRQCLLLDCTMMALQDAGITREQIAGSNTAVFVANASFHLQCGAEWDAFVESDAAVSTRAVVYIVATSLTVLGLLLFTVIVLLFRRRSKAANPAATTTEASLRQSQSAVSLTERPRATSPLVSMTCDDGVMYTVPVDTLHPAPPKRARAARQIEPLSYTSADYITIVQT
ncbi:polyketide synthase ThaQ-like [Littorina saxatilis]|uniref:polyketide synthase ThaQ-like n=1 Tax=Littorina saxatilis TaxID=31220 RepID=UPI0038B536A1